MTTATQCPGRNGVSGSSWAQRTTLLLRSRPSSVRRARAFVDQQCRAAGLSDEVSETAVLLASEVVTNAILHGRSRARLAVTTGADRVLVEVGDDSSRRPLLLAPDREALGGRGLAIVDMLADDWDVHADDEGKVVWFVTGAPAGAEAYGEYDRRHG